MGLARAAARILISLTSALVPFLFLSGPSGPFGQLFPGIFGSQPFAGSGQGASSFLPFGAAGLTGLVVYMVVTRVLSEAQSATYSGPRMNEAGILESVQRSMPWLGGAAATSEHIPADLTKSQFLILTRYRDGLKSSKDVARRLSMDRKEVEKATEALRTNGYLTRDNKITSKALEAMSK